MITGKVEEIRFSYPAVFKAYLSFKAWFSVLASQALGPWPSGVLSPGLALTFAWHWAIFPMARVLFNLSSDCVFCLTNPGVLKPRCVSELPREVFSKYRCRDGFAPVDFI